MAAPSFAVMGAGGVGGYFGARLAAAGCEVSFIARGAHLAALREKGLEVRSPLGDVTVHPVRATDDPAEIGPVDVVLFTVKLYDTESAGAAVRPLIGDDTAVVSLQNGVDAEERLAAILGPEHVMGGVAGIAAVIEEPGVIRHGGTFAWLQFGELDGRRSARAEALLAACQAAGIDAELSEHIERHIWRKFVFLAALSAVTCLARLPMGALQADPDARALVRDAMSEVARVAEAKGVDLGADIVDVTLGLFDGLPAGMKTSMQQDLERGNRLEVDSLSGAVVRMGAELGIDVPVHRTAYAVLKLHAEGRGAEAPA